MHRQKLLLFSILALIVFVPTSLALQPDPEAEPAALPTTSRTNQIIIQFEENSDMQQLAAVPDTTRLMSTLSQQAGVALSYQRAMSGGAHVLRLPEQLPESEVAAIAARLETAVGIAHAEPDRMLHIWDGETPTAVEDVPNDPLLINQWHYGYTANTFEGINAFPAWDLTTGDPSIVVAVLDTGILGNHPDLIGQTVPGYDFIDDTEVSNDGNRRDNDPSDPGDFTPANYCYEGAPFEPSSWHGTHVAGTIGASTNNGVGVAGVSRRSKILAVRVLGQCGGYTSDIADGIVWAAGGNVFGVPANPNPAHVINMSLGGEGGCSAFTQSAINQAVTLGATVVVASGNSNANTIDFNPGNCNNVVNVASNGPTGHKAFYSNFGSLIDVTAPGGDTSSSVFDAVYSTYNNGTTSPQNHTYAYNQGTSMAAPHVAGVAALMYAANPSITPAQVEQALKNTTRAFPAGSNCNTSICGTGIVDAFKAVCGAATTVATSTEQLTNPLSIPLGGFEIYLPLIIKPLC